ncbi:hypothetical protein OROGR_025222 [Orobanche gracilis]
MEEEKKVLIVYASQTGNAFDAAEQLVCEAERRCCPVALLPIDDFDANHLPNWEYVVFVVSTTGQGDTPDPMKAFWRYLLQKKLTHHWLKGVHCAVFGLGDSGYHKFNYVAKKLGKRLYDLGALPIVQTGLGDDQHPSGYEGALDPWMSSLWNSLYQYNPKLLPKGPDVTVDTTFIDQTKVQVTYHDEVGGLHSEFAVMTDLECLEMQIERAHSMSASKFSKQKARPHCFLQVINNNPLCKAGSQTDVRHMEFETVSSPIVYDVGDVLNVLPEQSPAAVDAFIKRCNLNPESNITIQHKNKDGHDALKQPIRLKTFVKFTMDVASASPRRYFFKVMSYFAGAQNEKKKLQFFMSVEGRDALYEYQKEQRSVLQVLEDFPSVQIPFKWLVQLVPPLKTRAFSISSSRLAHPNQVHLTVKVVTWSTPSNRKRVGLCSSWLAGLDPRHKVQIPVWFSKGSLPSPKPSLPLILIGPGTGCAPFHGFLEEREIQRKSCAATAPVIFFFGCRNEEDDFLYKNFWQSHSESGGILSEDTGGGFYVAFSREQREKVYAQHKMREQSTRVLNMLLENAAVYIAGCSEKMPSDVFSAFVDIICKELGVTKEHGVQWLTRLKKTGMYHVETWS